MPETELTPDDVVQLKRIHAGERNAVMEADVERWRAAGWLEPEPSWKLTKLGLAIVALDAGRPLELRFPDPGPDFRPQSAVRPRTPEEVRPVREALLRVADAFLAFDDPELRARARLAWVTSVLPLSSPEEVADALDFAVRLLPVTRDQHLYDHEPISKVVAGRRVALELVAALSRIVDDMRAEVGDGSTDRRRSVDPSWRVFPARPCVDKRLTIAGPGSLRIFLDYDRGSEECAATDRMAARIVLALNREWAGSPREEEGLAQLEREWDAVPVEDVERLYQEALRVAGVEGYWPHVNALASAALHIREIRRRATCPNP